MTLENKYNRGTHGDSSLMLSTVVLSNENQTCRGWEAHTSTGGGGCHQVRVRIHGMIARIEILPEEPTEDA